LNYPSPPIINRKSKKIGLQIYLQIIKGKWKTRKAPVKRQKKGYFRHSKVRKKLSEKSRNRILNDE